MDDCCRHNELQEVKKSMHTVIKIMGLPFNPFLFFHFTRAVTTAETDPHRRSEECIMKENKVPQ